MCKTFFFQTLPLSKKKNYKILKCVKYLVGPGNGDKAIILSQKQNSILKKMDNNTYYPLNVQKNKKVEIHCCLGLDST